MPETMSFLESGGLKYKTASASPSPMAIRHSWQKLFKVFTPPTQFRWMLSIFGERERPNYSAIRLDSLCCTWEGVSYWACVHRTYLQTCWFIVMHEKNKTESSLYTCAYAYRVRSVVIRHAWSRAPGQTCLCLSSVVSVARRPLLYSSASG